MPENKRALSVKITKGETHQRRTDDGRQTIRLVVRPAIHLVGLVVHAQTEPIGGGPGNASKTIGG